jgi:predicted transcriptional regulator
MSNEEIGLVLQMTPSLVAEYLAVYEQHNTPFCRQRLQEQLERLTQASPTKKSRGSDGS